MSSGPSEGKCHVATFSSSSFGKSWKSIFVGIGLCQIPQQIKLRLYLDREGTRHLEGQMGSVATQILTSTFNPARSPCDQRRKRMWSKVRMLKLPVRWNGNVHISMHTCMAHMGSQSAMNTRTSPDKSIEYCRSRNRRLKGRRDVFTDTESAAAATAGCLAPRRLLAR